MTPLFLLMLSVLFCEQEIWVDDLKADVVLDIAHNDTLALLLLANHRPALGILHQLCNSPRQGLNGDIAGLADGDGGVINGSAGLEVLHLYGDGKAVSVLILKAHRGVTVAIGLAGGAGDGDLPGLVGHACGVVAVLVGHGNQQVADRGLILHQLHLNRGLVGIVNQTAVGQTDGDTAVLVQRNRSVGNGVLCVGIGNDDQIAAYDCLTVAVSGGGQIELGDRLGFQLFTAVLALLVAGAFIFGSGFLVDDPVARLMPGGGLQDCAAGSAGGRLGTGGFMVGGMTLGAFALQIVIAAALATELGHTLAVAGGVGNRCTLVELMPKGIGIVGHKGAAAALAEMDGLAAVLTGGGNDMSLVVVGLGGGHIGNVAVAADLALLDGVAGAYASSILRICGILMLALGSGLFLNLSAVFADVQHFATYLAGGFTDHNALPRMVEVVHIVTLLDFAAVHAQIAGVAKGLAGGVYDLKDNEAVLALAAILVMAAPVAALFITAAVGISTAAGRRFLVTEPHIGDAVLGHALAAVGVSHLIIHGVLSLGGVVGSGSQGAALSGVAVANLSRNTGIGEVGNRQRMGLAVHHPVVVRNHALGGNIAGAGVLTVLAVLHDSEAVVADLGQNSSLHIVALQLGRAGVMRPEAEAAVRAALGGRGMIGAVGVLKLHLFGKLLGKLGGTVIEPVHILAEAVIGNPHIAVEGSAGVAARLSPVKAGVVGILSGGSVHDGTRSLAANQRTVRITDITGHGSNTVAGVLRGAVDDKGRGLPTDGAVAGLMGHSGVGIQLVGAVDSTEPMLGGVVVVVLLGGKRRGREQGNDEDKHKHHGRHALPVGLYAFVHIVVILHIFDFGHEKIAVLKLR